MQVGPFGWRKLLDGDPHGLASVLGLDNLLFQTVQPDARFILCRAPAELRHLREAGVWHFCHQYARRQTILDIVCLEALPHGAIGAQHGPIIGHVHHAALCRIAVVVLSPLASSCSPQLGFC